MAALKLKVLFFLTIVCVMASLISACFQSIDQGTQTYYQQKAVIMFLGGVAGTLVGLFALNSSNRFRMRNITLCSPLILIPFALIEIAFVYYSYKALYAESPTRTKAESDKVYRESVVEYAYWLLVYLQIVNVIFSYPIYKKQRKSRQELREVLINKRFDNILQAMEMARQPITKIPGGETQCALCRTRLTVEFGANMDFGLNGDGLSSESSDEIDEEQNEQSKPIVVLNCNHCFHYECLRNYVNNSQRIDCFKCGCHMQFDKYLEMQSETPAPSFYEAPFSE